MKITIIGAGAFGTSIAIHLANKGIPSQLWSWEKELCSLMKAERENKTFLPGYKIPPSVSFTDDLADTQDSEILISALPSHGVRGTYKLFGNKLNKKTLLLNLTKGIEDSTLKTMDQLLFESLPHIPQNNFAFLSGPSFAEEIAKGQRTAVIVSSHNKETAEIFHDLLHSSSFRVYVGQDVLGTCLGGSLKNILAIAAGVCDGLQLGLNSKAFLITRGLAEITRLAVKLGADPLTFLGLAGIGDLMLTCYGSLSRNRTLGEYLSHGNSLAAYLAKNGTVAEGVNTTRSAYLLAKQHNVDMPITEGLYKILFDGLSPKTVIAEFMKRDFLEELRI